ncbi:MAG: hypothetical protein P4L40_25730, partial [Terracidiphilus sp.]|nr:hypothetical protein [Terracidiphilus sp.]
MCVCVRRGVFVLVRVHVCVHKKRACVCEGACEGGCACVVQASVCVRDGCVSQRTNAGDSIASTH